MFRHGTKVRPRTAPVTTGDRLLPQTLLCTRSASAHSSDRPFYTSYHALKLLAWPDLIA